MKGPSLLLLSLLLVSLSACKTQEDIRRERAVESLNEQVQQTQKTTASVTTRFNTIEEQLSRLNGQMEEISHQRSQSLKENQNLNERINALEETNKKQVEYIKALTEKVNNQSDYIEEVIKQLEKMAKEEERPAKKKTVEHDGVSLDDQENDEPSFKNAIKKYNARDLDGAKSMLLAVQEDKKTKKKDREGATHFLGMIEYKKKNYEEAKVYFSKLFSDNPKSSFAAATLLNLARTFDKLKSKEEAIMTLEELQNQFPDSKEAAEGAKLKEKLK